MAGINDGPARQAQLTFAMARHAVVDLAQYFIPSPPALASDRLPPSSLAVLRNTLAEAGVTLQEGAATELKLRELRRMYEPHVQALSEYLLISLPPWFRVNVMPDNWQEQHLGEANPGHGNPDALQYDSAYETIE